MTNHAWAEIWPSICHIFKHKLQVLFVEDESFGVLVYVRCVEGYLYVTA